MSGGSLLEQTLSGKVIPTTADHPFYVQSQGWFNAGDLPGAKNESEEVPAWPPAPDGQPDDPVRWAG
jgi:hypothetical protein